MRRRVAAGAGAATLGVATLVTGLVMSTTVGYAESTTSSAYGLAAEGALPFEPTPYVESTDGSDQESEALELPENPLLGLEAAKVSAGDDEAAVELLNLELLPSPEIPEELAELQNAVDELDSSLSQACGAANEAPELAEIIKALQLPELKDNSLAVILGTLPDDALDPAALCDALEDGLPSLLELELVEVSCEGDSGTMELGAITLLGQEFEAPPLDENTEIIPANPLLTVTANKHDEGDDGSYSVTGLELDFGEGAQVLTAANATCGVPDEDDGGDDDEPEETATKPAPVTTGLPVTG